MNEPATAPNPATETTIYEGRPAALDSVGRWVLSVLTVFLAALVYWFQSIGLQVRITDQRIILKVGILSRKTEYLELYRVTDLEVEEPLMERMLGYGRLVIHSTDRNEAKLVLRGIKGPDALADKLRVHVEEAKRRRRVATVAEA